MSADIEGVARQDLVSILECDLPPASIDLDLDLSEGYGLTSLNKVLFLMSVCGDTGVELSAFTEPDVADMRTLGDVVTALAKHAPQVI